MGVGFGPDTLNPFEFFRVVVSIWGLRFAWRGLKLAESDMGTVAAMPETSHRERIAKINRRRRMQTARMVYSTIGTVLALLLWQGVVASFTGTGLGVETFATFSNNAVQLVASGALGRLAEHLLSDRTALIDTFTLSDTSERIEEDDVDDE